MDLSKRRRISGRPRPVRSRTVADEDSQSEDIASSENPPQGLRGNFTHRPETSSNQDSTNTLQQNGKGLERSRDESSDDYQDSQHAPNEREGVSSAEETQRSHLFYPEAFKNNGLRPNQRMPKVPISRFATLTVVELCETTSAGWDTEHVTFKFPAYAPVVSHTLLTFYVIFTEYFSR